MVEWIRTHEVMKPSQACIEFIKEWEKLRLVAYQDGGGVWTIGWGHTEYVEPGDTCTEQEADEFLRQDVQEAAGAIDDYVDVELTQPQYDALVSWAFNVGRNAVKNSTMVRMLNQGRSAKDVAPQFDRWNKDNGKVVAGLTRRRASEREMFESPEDYIEQARRLV